MKTGQASESLRKRPMRSDSLSRGEIVRLRLLRMTASEIADALGAKRDTVSGILQEPEVVAAIAEAEEGALEDAKAAMRTMTRKAAQVLHEALSSDDERIRVDAAKTLLTKAGADAPSKSEQKAAVEVKTEERALTLEEIEMRIRAIKALKAEEGK